MIIKLEIMKKEFAPHEESLELKELGFNEPCMSYFDSRLEQQFGNFDFTEIDSYDKSIAALAPTYSQAFRWFREKHNIDGFIQIEPLNKKYGYVTYDREKGNYIESERKYKVEEAELECLKKLIEIVKEKK